MPHVIVLATCTGVYAHRILHEVSGRPLPRPPCPPHHHPSRGWVPQTALAFQLHLWNLGGWMVLRLSRDSANAASL